jgi:hypothetical protein
MSLNAFMVGPITIQKAIKDKAILKLLMISYL